MKSVMIDGIKYNYEVELPPSRQLKNVDVYADSDGEHIVGVYINRSHEHAVVEGPDFQEHAPYFEVLAMSDEDLVAWAIYQVPGA